MTGRAEVAALAGKGAQGFMAAVCASDTGKSVMAGILIQDSDIKIYLHGK
jgi:hypothetical protein